MDHTHRGAGHSAPNLRPLARGRNRTLGVAALGIAVSLAGLQYGLASRRRKREDAAAGQPSLYVSVDRSGGGI